MYINLWHVAISTCRFFNICFRTHTYTNIDMSTHTPTNIDMSISIFDMSIVLYRFSACRNMNFWHVALLWPTKKLRQILAVCCMYSCSYVYTYEYTDTCISTHMCTHMPIRTCIHTTSMIANLWSPTKNCAKFLPCTACIPTHMCPLMNIRTCMHTISMIANLSSPTKKLRQILAVYFFVGNGSRRLWVGYNQ